ncbi:hypothetical protein [Vitreoscilla filiformis]|uniref:hypothetical protein n=1 Tax=Vitreoscilla filiformis TaxID=63 RepID=UPI000B7A1E49|nr:hypothetical protein [Vitreoscilla filiformis]
MMRSAPPFVRPAALCFGLAGLTTAVGVSMAAAAALERAQAPLDRGLMTAAAVALALGAHLLPALARRWVGAWALWLGCVLATLYGHAHFFTASSQRAGDVRAEAVQPTQQAQAWQRELDGLQARPLTVLATEQARVESRLAQAEATWQRCEQRTPGACRTAQVTLASWRAQAAAHQTERAQAERAAELHRLLTAAAAQQDAQRQQQQQDPVDRLLAGWLGVPVAGLGLMSSLLQSLLVELLAAVLWTLALHPAADARPSAQAATPATPLDAPPDAPTTTPPRAAPAPSSSKGGAGHGTPPATPAPLGGGGSWPWRPVQAASPARVRSARGPRTASASTARASTSAIYH